MREHLAHVWIPDDKDDQAVSVIWDNGRLVIRTHRVPGELDIDIVDGRGNTHECFRRDT
jgi:hypothetical protein